MTTIIAKNSQKEVDIDNIDEFKIIDVNSNEVEEIQDDGIVVQEIIQENNVEVIPVKRSLNIKEDSMQAEYSKKEMPLKQLQKDQERLDKEIKKEEERLERERKKEDGRKTKEEKRLQKELEKKRKEQEKERLKKEREAKLEQQRKEKEQRETQRLKEKEEKERQRLKEKLMKEKEKEQKEQEKKKAEEVQKKKQEKLQISNFFKPKATVKSVTVTVATSKNTDVSFYERTFKDFYLRNNTIFHTLHRPEGENLKKSILDFDTGLKSATSDLKSWFKEQPQPIIEPVKSSKYIHENNLENAPLRIKFIKFYENVKSWNGTYTKPVSKALAINPFQSEEGIFIDWDDEEDENEEGEGEDISEDEDDEEDDEEDDDIEDFLEQDQQSPSSQTKILGPLIPKTSWKEENELQFKIEILKSNISFPIKPFENYWDSPLNPSPTKHSTEVEELTKTKKAKTLITDKLDLEKFAKEVNESDYTIPTMVEILKKQLPNYTKMTIENTLKKFAKRVGIKPTERKWKVDTELLSKLIE